jgi:DNA-directed RNA polymerase specialized sigma24 family protein
MYRKADRRLTTFNMLAQHYQDEAYTLAYYLLGEETQASEATQAAFTGLFQRTEMPVEHFRMEMLRWVLAYCQKLGLPLSRQAISKEIAHQLRYVKEDERSALVLVDVLGLDYAEAGQVLHCSTRHISRLLAQGRLSLARQSESAQQLVMA